MKIVFFTHTVLEHGGGLEKYFIEVTSELAKRYLDFEISIVTLNEKRAERLQKFLSVYYRKRLPVSNIYREKTEAIIEKLGRVQYIKCATLSDVRRELKQYDLIYSKNELLELSILKWLGYNSLPPIIVGMHTPVYIPFPMSGHDRLHNVLYGGLLYKFLLRGTRAVHVINGDDLKLLRVKFQQSSVFKILLPFVSKTPKKNITNDAGDGNFHVAFIGRMTNQKGVDILLECFDQLRGGDDFSSLRFRFAGDGDTDIVNVFRELDRQYENVEYLGHIPNSDIDALYQWADVVLIPSRSETANYVVLEAGSNGKIVLVSDIPGPREAVVNGVTGFLLPLDASAFTEKIVSLFHLKREKQGVFEEIGEQAQVRIREVFSPDTIYEQFRAMVLVCFGKERIDK